MNCSLRWFLLFSVFATTFVARAQQPAQAPAQQAPAQARSAGVSVAIVIDDSNDAKRQFNDLRETVQAFVKAFGDEDELCVIGLGGRPQILQDLTFDPALIESSLRKVRPHGPPAVTLALQLANEQLQAEAANDKTAIVMFMGNEEMGSGAAPESSAAKAVPIHVIAGPAANWRVQEVVQRLTSSSGGVAYFPGSAKQSREIAAELGNRLSGRPDVATTRSASRRRRNDGQKLLAGYDELTVRSIPVADNRDTQQFMGGDNLLLQRVLVDRLKRAKLFREVIDGSDKHTSAADPAGAQDAANRGKQLEMRATLIKYDRGSRMKRQFTFGGAAKLALKVDMVDAVTGQVVDSFVKEGSAYVGGVFGGSQESVLAKAMLDVSNNVLKELRRNR